MISPGRIPTSAAGKSLITPETFADGPDGEAGSMAPHDNMTKKISPAHSILKNGPKKTMRILT